MEIIKYMYTLANGVSIDAIFPPSDETVTEENQNIFLQQYLSEPSVANKSIKFSAKRLDSYLCVHLK